MANSRFLQLLRNSLIKNSKEEAIALINSTLMNADVKDGTPYLCRYKDGDSVKTLLAIAYKDGDASGYTATIIGSDGADSEQIETIVQQELQKLNLSDSFQSNNFIATVNQTNGLVSVTRKTLVSTTDKILTYTEEGITSNLRLIRKEGSGTVKETYTLVGIDGETALGDVITINKDQSFKNAELGQAEVDGVMQDCLILTYVNSEGEDVVVNIPLGDFLKQSEFKNGLIVSENGEVSVNLSDVSGSSKNFIVMEGEEGSKSLAVREIDTDATKLQKDIIIAGIEGVLGTGYYKNGDTISKGTDVFTFLQNLLCKELYPNATVAQGSLSSKFDAPQVSIPSNGQTVEVGTKIVVPSFSGYEPKNTPVARKFNGFTYGYSLADDDSKDVDGNPADVNVTAIGINSGDYTVTRTYTGFGKTGDTATASSTNAVATAATIAQDETPIVAEGSNTVAFTIDGPGFSGTVVSSPDYYIVSNLGNTQSDKKVAAQAQQDLSNAKAIQGKSTYTVNGRFKYFLGYSENTTYDQFDSSSIRALTVKTGNITPNGTTTVVDANAIKSDGHSIVIACPNKYKLATVSNGLGADILANFSSVGEVNVTTGEIETPYTVYVYPITNSAVVEFKNVTLAVAGKSLKIRIK